MKTKFHKILTVLYIWTITTYTVFYFPFRAVETQSGDINFPIEVEYRRLGDVKEIKYGSYTYTEYEPFIQRYIGEIMLATAAFATLFILIKPKKTKTEDNNSENKQ